MPEVQSRFQMFVGAGLKPALVLARSIKLRSFHEERPDPGGRPSRAADRRHAGPVISKISRDSRLPKKGGFETRPYNRPKRL